MEIHIQKCQTCGSRSHRNVLVRDETQKVYVQCRQCDALVARYVLAAGGYFHEGKGFESFLRSIERDGGLPSAKYVETMFNDAESTSNIEFQELSKKLIDRYGAQIP